MAAKPILLIVDDDPDVLRAIERDLRRHYGREYRVLRADAGATALDALKQIDERGEPVALFLADQRMPQMSGVEFLEQARTLFPEAKRVLLTAYADTEAAIRAINTVKVDYYSMKPWDPPEENLYPVLDDLLGDWQAHYRPRFQGIRVIGHRWSADSHALKDFLGRNGVPYQWLDVESNGEEARALLQKAGVDDSRLPVVLFDDGSHLAEPSIQEVAEKIGGRTRASGLSTTSSSWAAARPVLPPPSTRRPKDSIRCWSSGRLREARPVCHRASRITWAFRPASRVAILPGAR
jgi:thioredoxin reductase (NADPH)